MRQSENCKSAECVSHIVGLNNAFEKKERGWISAQFKVKFDNPHMHLRKIYSRCSLVFITGTYREPVGPVPASRYTRMTVIVITDKF
jgi:hypothetical protein